MDFGQVANEETLFILNEEIADWAGDVEVGLYVGGLNPIATTALADLLAVEANGTWYTRKNATPGAAFDLSDGSLAVACTSLEWDYSGVSPSQVITGWFLKTKLVPRLIAARLLPAPVTMGDVLDSCIVLPAVRFVSPPAASQ